VIINLGISGNIEQKNLLQIAKLLAESDEELLVTRRALERCKKLASSSGMKASFRRLLNTEKLTGLLLTKRPDLALRFLSVTGVLGLVLPELDRCKNIKQNPRYHVDNVFEHCIKVCANTRRDPALRWAGLLHDIGKFRAFKRLDSGSITFHKHEVYSTQLARGILSRLKIEGSLYLEIVSLVRLHMYHYSGPMWALVNQKGDELVKSRRPRRKACEALLEELHKTSATDTLHAEVRLVEGGWSDKTLVRFVKKAGIAKKDAKNLGNIKLFSLRTADRVSRGLQPVTSKQEDFEERIRHYLDSF